MKNIWTTIGAILFILITLFSFSYSISISDEKLMTEYCSMLDKREWVDRNLFLILSSVTLSWILISWFYGILKWILQKISN